MVRFVVRRLLMMIPMVLVVISITWGLIRLTPGSFYTSQKALPPAVEQNIRTKYGLDKPWYVQYGRVLANTMRLDFGTSLKYQGQPVSSILKRTLPVSAALGFSAYLLSLVVGLAAGIVAAVKQNSRWDRTLMAVSVLGVSIPSFVLAPILILLFSFTFYWFPPARWEGIFSRNAVMPVLTLSAIYIAYIARLTRSGMVEVLRSGYIRTARAKGLSEQNVVLRHAFRGGILPVVSFTGPQLAGLITGTVVVERIFFLPGLGTYFINASLNRDEPLILGIVVFMSMTLLFFNLLVDIAYVYLDPRIRH